MRLSRRALLGSAAALLATRGRTALAASSQLAFDALGEIRPIYTPALIDEILASGTRAIAVTVTDPKTSDAEAMTQLRSDLQRYDAYLGSDESRFIRARTVADVDRAIEQRKLAVFYNVQNSTPVGRDLERVAELRRLGVTSVQLTYNDRNASGSGCFIDTDDGLTPFGRTLIDRLNQEHLLIDLSHAGMRTMADAVAASAQPVVVSHTACKALRAHRRNTTDENMRSVAERGGVVGITQIRTFLTDAKRDNLGVYFDHVVHAVKVAGVDHVAIGSDRDHRVIPDTEEEIQILLREEGAQFKPADWPLYLERLNGPRRMEIVHDELRKRGFGSTEVDKIMKSNIRRLYAAVIG